MGHGSCRDFHNDNFVLIILVILIVCFNTVSFQLTTFLQRLSDYQILDVACILITLFLATCEEFMVTL
jgi:hypothetical protein